METGRSTVFLVDDDITNLTVGKNVLSGPYNVITLNSAALMMEMLKSIQPDLILLDVDMPEMDGYEAIKKLKADKKTANIPVVFLTAMGNEEMELKGLSLGAIDYIAKPFSPPLLLRRIETHLLLETQRRKLIQFNGNLSRMVKEKTGTVIELKNAVLSTMAELVEYRDAVTGGHIVRTQKYIKAILGAMRRYGIYENEISNLDEDLILQSCQLHDVGKIAIRDSVLLKQGKLTDAEFATIKNHTVLGEKAILKLKDKTTDSEFVEYARIFAISHHERWDGSGYPNALKGEEIPLLGRIMAIADVYDALVEERPYKKAFPHEEAVRIMLEGRGSQFDPVLADLFEKINSKFAEIAAEGKQ